MINEKTFCFGLRRFLYLCFFSSVLFFTHFYASSYALSLFFPFRCQWIFVDFATAQSCVNIHNLNCSINQLPYPKKNENHKSEKKKWIRKREMKKKKKIKSQKEALAHVHFGRHATKEIDLCRENSENFRHFRCPSK